MDEMAGQQFHRGAPVYDVVGAMVGRRHVYDPEGGYITVRHGVLFHRDASIPLDAIRITDLQGNVHLHLFKDDLVDHRGDDPPIVTSNK